MELVPFCSFCEDDRPQPEPRVDVTDRSSECLWCSCPGPQGPNEMAPPGWRFSKMDPKNRWVPPRYLEKTAQFMSLVRKKTDPGVTKIGFFFHQHPYKIMIPYYLSCSVFAKLFFL